MNASQQSAFRQLQEANPEHLFRKMEHPANARIRCSCGNWQREFLRGRNAMARVSKQNAAMREHLIFVGRQVTPSVERNETAERITE